VPIEDSSVLREKRVGLQAINIISLLTSTVLK
jgi:hypothetical protein